MSIPEISQDTVVSGPAILNRSTDILSFLTNLRVLNSASLVQPLVSFLSLFFNDTHLRVFFKLIMQFSQICLLFYPIPERDLPLSLRRNGKREVISRRERH